MDTVTISLIYRKINGQLTEEEEEKFQAWAEASSEHLRYFERMRYYIEQTSEFVVSDRDVDYAWERFAGRIRSRRKIAGMVWRAGASIAALVVLFWGIGVLRETAESDKTEKRPVAQSEIVPGQRTAVLELSNGELHRLNVGLAEKQIGSHIMVDSCCLSYARPDSLCLQMAYNKLYVPRGGEYQLKLEDGTKVWLNSDSRLKYPEIFVGRKREVFLEGEAYFEVMKDTLRPFVVHAGNSLVMVLGTGFGITSYADEQYQTVTLVSGKVEVGFPEVRNTFILSPGRQAVYDRSNHQASCKNVDVQEYVAWKDGKYVFARKRLEDILNTLSRWYDFEVFYQDARCKDILFSGEIKRFEHFQSILELIQKTSDVKFDIRGNMVQVTDN